MSDNPYAINDKIKAATSGPTQPVKPIDSTSPLSSSQPPSTQPNIQTTPSNTSSTEPSYDKKFEQWGSEFRSWGNKDEAVAKFVNKMKTDSSLEAQTFRKETRNNTDKMTKIAENMIKQGKKFPNATQNIIFK